MLLIRLALILCSVSAAKCIAFSICTGDQFPCHDGTCIKRSEMCDGSKDCPDNSDEENCDFRLCRKPNWYWCRDNETCISSEFLCDGVETCPHGDDEANCDGIAMKRNIGCNEYEFTCSDKSCIPLDLVCDGKTDCSDDSDESVGCIGIESKCKGFVCKNKRCLESMEWRCDGIDDCGDGSDELNCKNKCLLEDKKFLCKDNETCIALGKVCDKTKDCPDGSDEGGSCDTGSCKSLVCPGECEVLPSGPACVCPLGFRNHQDKGHCIDIDECEIYGKCSQRCVNAPGSYRCDCIEKFNLQSDGRTCAVQNGEALLLYTTQKTVTGVYIQSRHIYHVAANLSQVIGVTYDGLNIYWTDIKHRAESIVKAREDGSKQEVIVSSGLELPEDLAVDWLTGNIYFTDNAHQHIAVCSNSGIHCLILVMDNVHAPRGIALHPHKGQMFWTDWGKKPMIGRASMDGTNMIVLVKDGIKWPNGIALDLPSDRLYWVDAKTATMETVRIDGTDRRVILRDTLKHPYGISVFEDRLYWSDWNTRSIHSCNKFTGKDHEVFLKDRTIYDIHIYHSALQPKGNHSCLSHKCSHLCLLAENSTSTCACPVGMTLGVDQLTCRSNSKKHQLYIGVANYLIRMEHSAFGRHNITAAIPLHIYIHRMEFNSLTGTIFVADNVQKAIYEVDPVTQTFNKLIGSNLGNISALSFDFMANNLYWSDSERRTIEVYSINKKLRGIVYHFVGNDEPIGLIVNPEVGKMYVALRSNQHTHIDMQSIDGRGIHSHIVEDRLGNSGYEFALDYYSKTLFWLDSAGGKIEFTDYRGSFRFLMRAQLRDPVSMAVLEEDIVWSVRRSNTIYYTHKSNMGSIKSFDIEKPPYFSFPDEIILTSSRPLRVVNPRCAIGNGGCSHICLSLGPQASSCLCPPGFVFKDSSNRTCIEALDCEFRCGSGECLTQSRQCNGHKDCADGSDETDCNGKQKTCSLDEFACHDGKQCVSSEMKCDHNYDCNDKSDEDHCENFDQKTKCHKFQFQCANKKCVDMTTLCDGMNDCGDMSDEKTCTSRAKSLCGKRQFRCTSGQCIPKVWECDGHNDCLDGSDEHSKCPVKDCPEGFFKCRMGHCIDKKLVCDRHNDCGDGSDEMNCDLNKKIVCEDPTKFQCPSDPTKCFDIAVRCNGTAECPRGEDEVDCSGCSVHEFQCADKKQCILKEFKCDEQKDCHDGSDEMDCGHYNASLYHHFTKMCQDGMFHCEDGDCIDQLRVCDGVSDCAKGDDENPTCKTACNNNPCQQRCTKWPLGPICSCFDGYRLKSDHKSCEDINECMEFSPCAQLCENTEGSYRCGCYPGFMLRNDKQTCKAVDSEHYILFSSSNEVRMLSENPIAMRVAWSSNDSRISGLDVDVGLDKAYFTIQDSGGLFEYGLKTHGLRIMNVGNPKKVAVDWITGNVYYVNHENSDSINVCSFHGTAACARIVKLRSREVIKAIAIDAVNKYLFYSSMHYWALGTPKSSIYRVGLDGSRPQVIVNDSFYISALGCDLYKKLLYYVDMHSKTLKSVDYEGSLSSFVVKKDSAITSPNGLSIYENHAYIVNTGSPHAAKCKLFGDKACQGLSLNVYNSEDIVVVGKSKQKNVTNVCAGHKCSVVCVQADRGPKCICHNGKVIAGGVPCTDMGEVVEASEIKSEPKSSGGSGAAIAWTLSVLALLALVGYFVYRRRNGHGKLNISMHFQNPLARARGGSVRRNEQTRVKMEGSSQQGFANRLSDNSNKETFAAFAQQTASQKSEDSDCESAKEVGNFDDDPKARLVL